MKKIALIVFLVNTLFTANGQRIKNSLQLKPGMTEEEVNDLLKKKPAKIDFYKNVVEYHYCSTGIGTDNFLALFFVDGLLKEKRNYSVTIQDTGGITGHCKNFIKMGNYKEPDTIQEIRVKSIN